MAKIGCCGFSIARSKYYSKFSCVEVQQTFYNVPKDKTLLKWRDETPDDFEFTVKAFQLITHPETSPTYKRLKGDFKNAGYFKDTDTVLSGWEKTKRAAEILGAKFILFQTPPSFSEKKEHIKNIEKFFEKINRGNFTFGWEERGRWNLGTVKKIKEKFNLIDVVDPFKRLSLRDNFIYFRLHGKGGYRYKYSTRELEYLLPYKNKTGYIMFNNTNMIEDSLRFNFL